jgi:hypothetical protein
MGQGPRHEANHHEETGAVMPDLDLDAQVLLSDIRARVLRREPISPHEYRDLITDLRRGVCRCCPELVCSPQPEARSHGREVSARVRSRHGVPRQLKAPPCHPAPTVKHIQPRSMERTDMDQRPPFKDYRETKNHNGSRVTHMNRPSKEIEHPCHALPQFKIAETNRHSISKHIHLPPWSAPMSDLPPSSSPKSSMPRCVPTGAHVRIGSSAAMFRALSPPAKISVHLHFGGCLAKGLETARREFFAGGSPDRALFNGCEAIIAAWGNFQGPDNPNVNEKKKSLDACILSLAEYFKTWPLESDDVTIHVHRGEPASSSALPSRSPDLDTPSLAIQSYMLAASISSVTILKLCGASTTKPPRPCPLLRNGDCAASSPGIVGDRENTE